ncbi:MAG: hypothetical protein J6Q89_05910 [Clostridia bacterium]|nr:hypothetical protein [Clostridia bacterium]
MSNETKNLKSLKERAKSFDVQLPFMEGRDKGETKELLGQVSTINEYGFIPNDAGEAYVVFTVKERANKFYFGGSVLTARMLDLENEGYHDAIVAEGLPVLLTEEKSKKSNRMYTNVKFYPED